MTRGLQERWIEETLSFGEKMMDFNLSVKKIAFQFTLSTGLDTLWVDPEPSLNLCREVEGLTPKPIYPMLITFG